MQNAESIRNEISFNGVDGLSSPELIQAIRNKAFIENKIDDFKYMAVLVSLCLTGPALKWFENLDDQVQSDWSLLRRALLARFSDGKDDTEISPLFTGGNPKQCEDFVRSVRKHTYAEGKTQDDRWIANYAASCMAGEALKWHAKLDTPVRNSWIQIERALLAYFPNPPPYTVPPAGRVLIKHSEPTQAPSFLPRSRDAWLRQARERRATYNAASPGERSSVYWLLIEDGDKMPDTAIQTGLDPNGFAMFTSRTWHEDGLHPGKAALDWSGITRPRAIFSLRSLQPAELEVISGSLITLSNQERWIPPPCEILVGDKSVVHWISNPWTPEGARNAPSIDMKAFHAVEGGVKRDGTALLLVQSYRQDCGWQPGTAGGRLRSCEIGWHRKVLPLPNFRILVWAE